MELKHLTLTLGLQSVSMSNHFFKQNGTLVVQINYTELRTIFYLLYKYILLIEKKILFSLV